MVGVDGGPMGHHQHIAGGSHGHDAAGLGDAAQPGDVWLQDVRGFPCRWQKAVGRRRGWVGVGRGWGLDFWLLRVPWSGLFKKTPNDNCLGGPNPYCGWKESCTT